MENEKNLNITDREFYTIKRFIENRTEKEITMFICENYNSWVNNISKDLAEYIIGFHKRFKFWGNFDPINNNIDLIIERAHVLKNKWKHIEELYNSLSDYRSKNILIMILENWLSFSFDRINKVKEHNFDSYFDMDLLQVDTDEIFVDLGAYKGDTIDDYINVYGLINFNKIYAYEIIRENIEIIDKKYYKDSRVILRPVGVSDKNGIMYISDNGTSDAQSLSDCGKIEVETVTLDEDIKEKITFLKMDIEGSEKKAIIGAKNHIKRDNPKLAISIYHSNDDLVDIFNLIREIQPNYKFYLRYNGLPYFPTDYILIGIPIK